MRPKLRRVIALTLLCAAVAGVASSQDGPLASGQLLIQGNRLTLFADELTTDADQTVNVGEQARVRTCFGGPEVPCGSILPGDPRIAGLIVEAELSGPELPQALALRTVPGGAFVLPSFQQEGDYRLENIRLVNEATGQVLGAAEPSAAVLHVRQIVLASASVRALSLEELRERGVVLTEKNFQAFNFAVGFALGDEIVEIEFPVVYSGNGVLDPVVKPRVMLDNLPPDTIDIVKRWKPPTIVPFRLEKTAESRDLLTRGVEGDEELDFPLFGAIVIPGTVTFLNQFFEARLIVANGAGAGTGVTLENLRGALRLPSGNVLRLAETDPPVGPGQEVPVAKPGGGRVLAPGDQGTAAWTVEGLLPGTHALQMDITGDLARPGRDPLPVLSRAQAAVEVVDARFNLTFSHPDVVREGVGYTLFVTVSNLSQAAQNLITVEIRDEHVTGAHKADPTDDFRRTIDTLAPGQSATVEYELVADVNGQVIASTFQADSPAVTGTIRLRTGVGPLGIPLSPATLVMPRFTDHLDPPFTASAELVKAHVRLLGLGYSLAVAPSGRIPPGVPRVVRSDVERRAVDLAEAGQRVYLQEQMLETLEVLALDWLGNREPLGDFDEIRRRVVQGARAASQLAAQIRREQAARSLSALEAFDHFGETASYARPWMAATVVPGTAAAVLDLEVRRATERGPGVLAGISDDEDDLERTLPYGEIYGLQRSATGGPLVPLALVGHVGAAEVFQVVVRNPSSQAVSGHLVLTVPDGDTGDFRRLDFGVVTVAAGGAVAVDAGASTPGASSGGFRLYDPATAAPTGDAAVQTAVALPPFRVIGARQDFRLAERGPDALGNMLRPNRYGSGLTYLFNRPPDRDAAEDAASWAIRSTWSGLDTVDEPASGEAVKTGEAAYRQENSERVVNVRYSGSIAALRKIDGSGPLVDHEHQLDAAALVDERGHPLDPDVPAPVLETMPLHVGGLVGGVVKRGTGEPAPGTVVELIRPRFVQTGLGVKVKLDLAGTTTADGDGRFFFEYVENPNWDPQVGAGFTLRATVPAGADPELEPAQVQEISSFVRRQNRLARVNVQLLGRGTVTGRLVYLDDQQPVPRGTVTAASTLFQEIRTVAIEADGSFRIPSLPVGPITLSGRDDDGRAVYATVGIDKAGDAVDVHLEIQRNTVPQGRGTVLGRVLRSRNGATEPAEGARVQLYSDGRGIAFRTTGEDGAFFFRDVPAGRVSLQAADWRISRTPVFTDLRLADGETFEIDLLLIESSARTVVGQVYFDDPVTGNLEPVEGAVAFIPGPGNYAYTDSSGQYRIEGVPVQGVGEPGYVVDVIDNELQVEKKVDLPQILDVSPDVIQAPTIVFSGGVWEGGVDGVVLDPLGRPASGVEVILFPFEEKVSGPDGSFSFDRIPVGRYEVVAHVGDGLEPGRVGWFGEARAEIVHGGHRPFVTLRMAGSGVVSVEARTESSTGVLTPIFYKPTYFSPTAKDIVLRGSFIETSTDELGDLQLVLPVGPFEVVAFNPFHGIQEVRGEVDYPGQLVHLDIVFESAGVVEGQVVDVNGTTPVPDVEVTLFTRTLEPQRQRTDAQGRFRFELVPKGGVTVTAAGLVGTVERVGRTDSNVAIGGQVVDLIVEMKAQGSIRGQVLEDTNGAVSPIPFAQYFVQENTYPFRRLPEDGTFFLADAEGRYQVSHLFAGRINVVARDPLQVTRKGAATAEITADWQVAPMPDIVMKTSVGSLRVVVRDPATGGPVADALVRLSNLEVNSSDSQGVALYEALPLTTYSVYAFNAATGQSGRVSGVRLTSPGQLASATVYLDQRGEVLGTLWDDAALTTPVGGGTVRLTGRTAGGRLTALATTSGRAETLGRFELLGIPEGAFSLAAAVNDSPRRTSTVVELTETAPVIDVNLVLEPVADVHVRLFEELTAGVVPVDLGAGVFSVRGRQGSSYDFTQIQPLPASEVYFLPDVLLERSLLLEAQELAGEQRTQSVTLRDLADNVSNPIPGDGSFGDPYRLTLKPKGTVVVHVARDSGAPAPAVNVRIPGAGTSVTGAGGSVTFYAVRAGGVNASATDPVTLQGGTASGVLTYDDEVLTLAITLSPAVSAHGLIYQPVPDDRLVDASQLVPMEGAIVQITDSKGQVQTALTAADGTYGFDVLPTGFYLLTARNDNGEQRADTTGTLLGPDGHVNELPPLLLDASPPRILSIVPPPGIEGVSRLAPVEIVFSEPLLESVLPHGQPTSLYFELRSAADELAVGAWDSYLDPTGRQVVRFEPSEPYDNLTFYSLTILGGKNGVKDRLNRRLVENGNVGSNFKTSDSVGPAVIGTVPSLDVPVDPGVSIRVDFNEAVVATTELLDGDGVGDAATLYGEGLDASGDPVWVPLPLVLFLTRSGYSLQVEPVAGIAVQGDTLRRRLVVADLEDAFGNPMPVFEKVYRLYDSNAPVLVELPLPDNAPGGDLIQGVTYTVTPVIGNVDAVTPENPGGDVDRVEYFFQDPADPANPQTPSYSAVEHPFGYSFIGAYSGNGVDPRSFPIWARVVDTSANASGIGMLEMRVLPNSAPAIGAVAAVADSPVAGTFYAGSRIRAVVSGLDDVDGSELTLSVELRRDGDAFPIDAPPGRTVVRPAGGWQDLLGEEWTFAIPIDLPEATPLYFLARVIDSQGAVAELESDRFPVADDAAAPSISFLKVTDDAGHERFVYFIGERIVVELRAAEAETRVQAVEISFDRDDIFPSPVPAVEFIPGHYRTAPIPVPPDTFFEATPVEVTARAYDYGANVAAQTLTIDVAPEPDPNAPFLEWLTPWQGAAWPADYTSVFTPQEGTPFLLRVLAEDTTEDAEGNVIPGQVINVRFRGPVVNEAGEVELSADWTDAELVAGTGSPEGEGLGWGVYELLWFMPNQVAAGTELPFAARVVDAGGGSTVQTIRMTAVTPRKVYEGVQTAVAAGDPMLQAEVPEDGVAAGDPDGPVFLLDGSLLSVLPQADGAPRRLAAMYLYAGGEVDVDGNQVTEATVLTAPEITSIASAILWNPLELEIDGVFGVGAFARVDLSGKGLIGSGAEGTVSLPGEVPSEPFAGGSHGGRGWFGAIDSRGWNAPEADLWKPGSVYGSLRDPDLPGSGGSTDFGPQIGGHGGGVIRILAPGGALRLAGDLLANGARPPSATGGGGAGGSIRVVAGRIDGRGRVEAAGSPGARVNRDGGGGGGRISISYGDLGPEVDLLAQTDASGGLDHPNDPSKSNRLAGAGTIYLEPIDPATGAPLDDGTAVVGNKTGLRSAVTPFPALGDGTVAEVVPEEGRVVLGTERVDGEVVGESLVLELETGESLGIFRISDQARLFDAAAAGFRVELVVEADLAALQAVESHLAAATPVLFHGRARLDTLAVSGASRVLVEDDLVLVAGGPVPALNDRSRLVLGAGARVLLRGEAPEFAVTAVPAEGVVRLGTTLELTWTATDPVGFVSITETWSLGAPLTRTFTDGPLQVTHGAEPILLTIPFDTPAGPVSYTLEGVDTLGRSAARALTWEVLPNAAPSGFLSLADGAPAALPPGESTTVVVHAEDPEGLSWIETASIETSSAEALTFDPAVAAVTGTVEELAVTVTVAGTAQPGPVSLRARLTDAGGLTFDTAPLELTVLEDGVPPQASIDLLPATGDVYTSGDVVDVRATGTDNVAVAVVRLLIDGVQVAEGPPPLDYAWIVPPVPSPTLIELVGEAEDPAGNTGSASRTVTAQPLDDPVPPAVGFDCPTTGALLPSGYELTLSLTATDDLGIARVELFRGAETTPFATLSPAAGSELVFPVSVVETLPAAASEQVVRYRAVATDGAFNTATQEIEVRVVPAGDLDPAGINDWAALETQVAVLRSGTLSLAEPRALGGLIVLPSASLGAAAETDLDLTVAGTVYVACGGTIDVSGRGYAGHTTYPGEVSPGGSSAGSHMGVGGVFFTPAGSVYGSVYRPREHGSGGESSLGRPGGGVVRLRAGGVVIDGGVLANSLEPLDSNSRAGAGGSVWITASGTLSGAGRIEAGGGEVIDDRKGRGGGGAIAVEYGSGAGALFDNLRAYGGDGGSKPGGAGTVYLFGPASTYGDLVVDSGSSLGGTTSAGVTELPSLGAGTALAGSGGEVLVSDRAVTPAYFEGHWVEVYDGATGALEGTWRLGSVAGDTWTLAPNGAEAISVDPGDLWQGVYLFDNFTLRGTVPFESRDPVLVGGTWTVAGDVELREVIAGNLTVLSGGRLAHPATEDAAAPERLEIDLLGELRVEAGGAIDVSGQGYRDNQTYPGAVLPGSNSGGSHLGYGGLFFPPLGATYGSVYRPLENGGGGANFGTGRPGGGAVRVRAASAVIDGAILANGLDQLDGNSKGGAGGSVWLTISGTVAGDGTVEALGGSLTTNRGSGGGGAIAVEYGSSAGSVIDNLRATGGDGPRPGGAGTVYLRDSTATWGELIVDNDLTSGQATELPTLGGGTALAGSAGATLVTDRGAAIPAYFVGHWVEVRDGTGTLEGTYRIAEVSGMTAVLESADGQPVSVDPGDAWRGVYHFDAVTVAGGAVLMSVDPVFENGVELSLSNSGPLTTPMPSKSLWESPNAGVNLTRPLGESPNARANFARPLGESPNARASFARPLGESPNARASFARPLGESPNAGASFARARDAIYQGTNLRTGAPDANEE